MNQSVIENVFNLSGQVVVITGGTGILGSSFVKVLAAAGAKVLIIGRKQEVGSQLEEEVKQSGGEAVFMQCDVLNKEELHATSGKILQQYGKIDALVNAAGGNVAAAVIGPDDDLFEMNLDALHDVFELNLFGTVLPSVIFGKHIAEQGGSIVNISSMASQKAITRVLGYSMAKAGVDNFTKWMSVEMARRYKGKVRINAIAPGFFVTTQNRHLLVKEDGGYTPRGEAVIRNTPYQRFGNPEELNGTLIWLLSPASGFVTGEIICVDGGFNVFSGV
ncbi:SDR family oxidoreductase [Foetidibacter luteolus]|uniref:SDR family oxidoreductase n=1 Tax=Foetidibacter luteolus TaxID=2608880 RepID=UPI00129B9748|nr:SDR family oxidoreductase [Foetidibacter luteolus]